MGDRDKGKDRLVGRDVVERTEVERHGGGREQQLGLEDRMAGELERAQGRKWEEL